MNFVNTDIYMIFEIFTYLFLPNFKESEKYNVYYIHICVSVLMWFKNTSLKENKKTKYLYISI